MSTKKLVFLSLLLSMGFVLHSIIPGVFFGMKPDMLLVMMFLGIILFPDRKTLLLLGIGTGMISALTTSFPGGQIANMIDKPITAVLFFILFTIIFKYKNNIYVVIALTVIGTIISGTIFLASAYFLVGLPSAFILLFATVVLPTAVINSIMIGLIYPIVIKIKSKMKFA